MNFARKLAAPAKAGRFSDVMNTKFLALFLVFLLSACVTKGPGGLKEIGTDCYYVKYHFESIPIKSLSKAKRKRILISIVSETSEEILVRFEFPNKMKEYPLSGIYFYNLQADYDESLESKALDGKTSFTEMNIPRVSMKNISVFINYSDGRFCPSGTSYKLEIGEILK